MYTVTRHGFQKVFSFLLLVKVAANIISGTIYTLYFPSLCNTKQFAIYEILEPILHYLKCTTDSIFWSFESSAVWRWKGRYTRKYYHLINWLICKWNYLKWSQLPCGEISGVEIQHIVEKFQIGHMENFSLLRNYKSIKFQIIIHSNIISVCFVKIIQ